LERRPLDLRQWLTPLLLAASLQPVVLIPAHREKVDLFRTTHTDQNGKYTMTDLAPGEYKVFSWEAVDTNAYMDPEFLQPYEHLGKAISVTDSSSSSVGVKLIPAQ
jgi:hypothetical protein